MTLLKCQLTPFVNPSQPHPVFDAEGYGLNHWAGNVHVLPIRRVQTDLDRNSGRDVGGAAVTQRLPQGISFEQMTDGTSNTLLLGSVGDQFKAWGHPANVRDPALGINVSPESFGGPPGWQGAMFLLSDGSVRFLGNDTDRKLMEALATPAGGELLPKG